MSVVPEIEQQHHALVSLINKLDDAVKNDEPLHRVEGIIDDVIAYSRFHFAAEERLMDLYQYPHVEAHKDKHKQLLHDAFKFKEKFRYIGKHEFADWLNHWPFAHILAHIVYADRQVEDHIAESLAKM
jgi:hemerythrin